MGPTMNSSVLAYEEGEIPAQAALTAQITCPPGTPLQGFIDAQYLDSQSMDKRPGMHLKYLPYLYDGATGKLLTGGSYLFETWEDARDYARWTTDDFRVGEPQTRFWDQPMFQSSAVQTWRVVGACNFKPVETHAAGRFQYWTYPPGADAAAVLPSAYASLRDAARSQGLASVWLLHNAEDRTVGIQLATARADGEGDGDGESAASRRLLAVSEQPSLTQWLPASLGLRPVLDRSSLFLTLWLPKSRAAGGAELCVPNYPVVPAITHDHLGCYPGTKPTEQ